MAGLNVKTFTAENWENDVLKAQQPVLVDFWAEWCGPCRMFGPTFEKVSEKHPDIAFTKVDTEKEQKLAGVFGIQSIPTLAIFRDNIMIFKQAGALPENALEDVIKQVRELDMDKVREEVEAQKAEAETQAA